MRKLAIQNSKDHVCEDKGETDHKEIQIFNVIPLIDLHPQEKMNNSLYIWEYTILKEITSNNPLEIKIRDSHKCWCNTCIP